MQICYIDNRVSGLLCLSLPSTNAYRDVGLRIELSRGTLAILSGDAEPLGEHHVIRDTVPHHVPMPLSGGEYLEYLSIQYTGFTYLYSCGGAGLFVWPPVWDALR